MYIRGRALRSGSSAVAKVYVDEFSGVAFKGRILHMQLSKCISFSGFLDFLNKLESLCNHFDYPQKTLAFRTFGSKTATHLSGKKTHIKTNTGLEVACRMEDKDKLPEHNGKATFIIKVLYRQNATWQGTIHWVEEKKTQNFRSDLEMLKLMDDAVRMAGETGEDTAKWE